MLTDDLRRWDSARQEQIWMTAASPAMDGPLFEGIRSSVAAPFASLGPFHEGWTTTSHSFQGQGIIVHGNHGETWNQSRLALEVELGKYQFMD